MKKKLTIFCFLLAFISSFFFAQWNSDFWMGVVGGISVFGLLTCSIGFYIASKHVQRLDKLQNDYFEEISHNER